MWLSRLGLNPRSRAVRRDLSDCHQLHRTLLSGFPSIQVAEPRKEVGLLHRLEQALQGNPVLLVQSLIQPDWSKLPIDYCMISSGSAESPCAVKPIGHILDAVQIGSRFRFRLVANPTRRITRDVLPGASAPSARVELRTEDQWQEWMLRQADKHGFRLGNLRCAPGLQNLVGLPAGRLQGRRNGDRLTVFTVRFEGTLKVINEEHFREAIKSGIGPAKAYGCGLLSIGRTDSS
jgi:CRISPR system Cascade subunit CasE